MYKFKIAVLDDYQNVALTLADWTILGENTSITVFNDHLSDEENIIERLKPFDIVCVMRERTPLSRDILTRLTNLKLIVSTGERNASIDLKAAEELDITVKNTRYVSTGATELTWALLMAIARKIPEESLQFKSGGWQTTVGTDLAGKTLGIVGLGRIGQKMAAIGNVFDMKVIAWSENLDEQKAAEHGAAYVSKETLFRESDFITLHLVLSKRSKGIVDKEELNLMKPSAYLINTSRGPLVNEEALIDTLVHKRIAGAAIDVFDTEPLPVEHPFRKLDNMLGTPHIGFVTENTYKLFYQDTVEEISKWLLVNNK
jgi:phosphoglycerate dehydrogenase-like enzyme